MSYKCGCDWSYQCETHQALSDIQSLKANALDSDDLKFKLDSILEMQTKILSLLEDFILENK